MYDINRRQKIIELLNKFKHGEKLYKILLI